VRGIAGLSSPLVGREAELRALQAAIERLRSGVGGIVTVVGEAGIGKSRLVAEIRADQGSDTQYRVQHTAIEAGNTQWVEGRCLSYATGVAYQVWADALRSLLCLDADTPPEAVAETLREQVHALCQAQADEVYPFLAQMISLPLTGSAETRLHGIDGEGLQVLTFRAVETFFVRAAQHTPLVFVCEDLHWADPTSLALLEHLLPLTDRVPLLVICVLRPEKDHGCWRIRETADRLYGHRHTGLWLDPLSASESAQLIGSLLHIEDLPRALRARILDRAEGNPFYLEEILRSLIDEGTVAYDEFSRRWQAVQEVGELALPDALRGVLVARIHRLPLGTRQVMQLASVVGRMFSQRVLEAICSPIHRQGEEGASRQRVEGPCAEGVLDAHLVALQRAQMVRERSRVPEATYAFKHQLTLEAAYESLLRRKRRVLHRRVAEVLERLYPEQIEGQLGLLAHHWECAGDVDKAVAYLRRAGERAATQFANAEAVEYLSRALALVPDDAAQQTPEGAEERYALLLARERVYDLQGDREAQAQDLVTLSELAEAHGDHAKQAKVAVLRARYSTRIDEFEQAISAARAAARLARVARDVRSETMAYREWGRALFYQREYEAARPHLERALALARDAGLRRIEAEILHTLAVVLGIRTERGMTCTEQALRICREMGARGREGEALRDVGYALLLRFNWTGAEAYLRQSLDVCREMGNRRDEAWALRFLGEISYHQGHYARARNYDEQSLRICREARDREGESFVLWGLGYTCIALADYAATRDYLEQGLRLSRGRSVSSRANEGWALVHLGLACHLQGDHASARTHYERALGVGREIDRWSVRAGALLYAGLLSHHQGDDSAALAHGQQALRIVTDSLSLPFGHSDWPEPTANATSANMAGKMPVCSRTLGNTKYSTDWDVLRSVELTHVFTVLGHALAGLGHQAEAADAYRQALTMRQKWGQHHLAVEPLAGLARVALVQKNRTEALAHVGEILDYMEDHPALAGTLEPLRIYLTCYRVLSAIGDPRASGTLDAAYRLLQERAATIEDEDLRCSYLENVAAHRELVALWP
jgi:predicted ATPase